MLGYLRLVDLNGNELLSVAEDPFGLILTNLDLGFPAPRAVSTPTPGGDGSTDTTRYVGERAITAEVVCAYDAQADRNRWVDAMSGLMHPGWRYWLHVFEDGWASERRILVRGDTFTRTATPPVTVQMGWHAQAGLFEDTIVNSQILSPSGGAEGGLSLPLTFPMSFGVGVVPGYAYVTVGGTVPTPPTIDMYGPCSAPSVELVGTGQTVEFPGLALTAGTFLRVDLGAHTAYLNGDPTQSRYQFLDFAESDWWMLPPGVQQLLFAPASPGAGCQAVVSWRTRTISA